jgi:hypothetical protein
LDREDIKSDGHVRNSIEENIHMYRSLIVVILMGIFLAQDAPASQVPNSRTEVNVDTMSMPHMAKAQPSRAPDILESKLVGRLYTLTYGGRELCEQVGLEEAARFNLVLEGFHDAFPDVMQRFKQSSFFEETRRGFSRWVKESPELKSKDELANLCLADYKLLKAYTDNKDDPEVVENVLRIRTILTH